MDLKVPIESCTHIKEISSYNHNYYKLPVGLFIDDCDVIYEICNEDYDSYEYILGKFEEGKFSDDGKHIRYPSSYGFNWCYKWFMLDSDRKNDYNT